MQEGESFKNSFKLSPRWFKQFKASFRKRYEFHYDKDNELELVYEHAGGEHVLTYNLRTGETYTDWSLSKLLSILEDAMGGVGAPMATLNNTPGMGNATPAHVGGIGSGDNWGDASVGKLATQVASPIKEEDCNEDNISPYDTLGTSMAKKMKVKTPFMKKKIAGNQNAVKQRKFEHTIISLDQFMNINESDSDADNESYRKKLFNFLDAPWQEDNEIYFIALLDEYRHLFAHSSKSHTQNYLSRVYNANGPKLLQLVSDNFLTQLDDLINN